MSPDTGSQSGRLPSWLLAARWQPEIQWPGLFALAGVLVSFWVLGGVWGAVGWLVVAVLWLLFPPVIPVAVGQFVVVALTPPAAGIPAVLPGTAALGGLLLADIATESMIDGLSFVFLALLTGSSVWILVGVTGIVPAAGVLVAGVACGSYLLRRYLLVQLGVTGPASSSQLSETEQ